MKHILPIFTGMTAFAIACSATAGGYQLNDYSVTGLGRSYAGQGVVGDDYSAIAFNPVGMTLMKSGAQAGLSLINLRADVDSLDGKHNHKKMDFWAPMPNLFTQYNVDDKLSLGFGVYAPFGLKTVYDAGWFGDVTARLSKLEVIDFNLSAAYRVTDTISVGASVIARYIYGHLTNALLIETGGGYSDFELDGWTKTGALGIMYEPTKDSRIGLSYRLRSTQQVKGDHIIEGSKITAFNERATGWASPDLPETVTLSAYHRYKDVGFTGTARWTHWSQSFPKFVMRSNSRYFANVLASTNGEKVSYYNYDNTWTLTVGADWYYNKNWTFRVGTGYDESPAHDDSARTIRIPDNDRFWLSCGFSYVQPKWQVDFGYAHMMARTAKAYGDYTADSVPVKYSDMQSHILGLQYQYRF